MLELRDRLRSDCGERRVAEVLRDEAESFFLELDRPRRAANALSSQVRLDGFREALRALLVNGQPAVSSLFDQLALVPCGDPQIRRAEALAVTTAVDREVCPGTGDRVSRDSYVQLPELRVFIRRGFRPGVNCTRPDEVVHVRRQVSHRATKSQEPWSLASMSPRAQRRD